MKSAGALLLLIGFLAIAAVGIGFYGMHREPPAGGIIVNAAAETGGSPAADFANAKTAGAPETKPSKSEPLRKLVIDEEKTTVPKKTREARTISGRMVNYMKNPLPNGRVWLTTGPKGNKRVRETFTNQFGEFTFDHVTNSKGWIDGIPEKGSPYYNSTRLSSVTEGGAPIELRILNDRSVDYTEIQALYPNGSAAPASVIFETSGGYPNNKLANQAGFFIFTERVEPLSVFAIDADYKYMAKVASNISFGTKNIKLQFTDEAPVTRVKVFGGSPPVEIPNFGAYFRHVDWPDVTTVAFSKNNNPDDRDDRPAPTPPSEIQQCLPFERGMLRVTANGYITKDIGPFEAKTLPPEIKVTLDPCPYISGFVTYQGRPVQYVRIDATAKGGGSLQFGSNGAPQQVYTDSEGGFRVYYSEPVEIGLYIVSEGYLSQSVGPIAADPKVKHPLIPIVLEQAGNLSVELTDELGRPGVERFVEIENADNERTRYTTDFKGIAVFKNMRPGTYKLCIRPFSEAPPLINQTMVQITGGETTHVPLVCPAKGSVEVNYRVNGILVNSRDVAFFSNNITVDQCDYFIELPHFLNSYDDPDRSRRSVVSVDPGQYRLFVSEAASVGFQNFYYLKKDVVITKSTRDLTLDVATGSLLLKMSKVNPSDERIKMLFHCALNDEVEASGVFYHRAEATLHFPVVPAGKCSILREKKTITTFEVEAGKEAVVEVN